MTVGIVDNESHKIAIAGAGGIGLLLAEKLANEGYEVVLYNRDSGEAKNAERQNQVYEINANAEGNINFTHDLSEVKDCDVVHYIQGAQRAAGADRLSVFSDNAPTLENDIPVLLKNNQNATFVSTANPMDHMTRRIAEIVENEARENRDIRKVPVIGMGSALDTTRLHNIVSDLFDGEKKVKNAWVRGAHDGTSVPIFSQMTIDGRPASDYLTEDNIEDITNRMRAVGGEIKKETGSSDTEGPAAELHEMTNAMTGKIDGIDTPCVYFSNGSSMKASSVPNGSLMHHINNIRTSPITEGYDVSEQEQTDLKASKRSLDNEYKGLQEKSGMEIAI